jgi:hypothetical protein
MALAQEKKKNERKNPSPKSADEPSVADVFLEEFPIPAEILDNIFCPESVE